MKTFTAKEQEYKVDIVGNPRQLSNGDRNMDRYCVIVKIYDSSNQERWTAATHLTGSALDGNLEDRLIEYLTYALEDWGPNKIPDKFDIPQGHPQAGPQLHEQVHGCHI